MGMPIPPNPTVGAVSLTELSARTRQADVGAVLRQTLAMLRSEMSPEPEEAATDAIAAKGAGDAVDGELAARVAGQTGADVSGARVHKDARSRAAARAISARAFAHGSDIFLGPGESELDPELMGHELTHVAQQTGGVQRKVTIGAANSPAEQHADDVGSRVAAGAPPQYLIVDTGPLVPGQMYKRDFILGLRAAVVRVVEEELGKVGATAGCPYLDRYFSKYAGEPARVGEDLLRRWLPGAKAARTVGDLVPLVLARVREAVHMWSHTGQLPSQLAMQDPEIAAEIAQSQRPVQRTSLEGIEAELGSGQLLDDATAARMSHAVGSDVSGVRVHSGATAQRMAADVDATAFAVGQNVVLGARAPTSGLAADALLAHELAHTAQQKDAASNPTARKKPIGEEDAAAELDADQAAGAGLAKLHNFAGAVGDVMRTGLQLQRCPSKADPAKPMDEARYKDIQKRLSDLVAAKKAVVEGTGKDDMTKIDGEIDRLIAELRVDFGVRMDKGKILDAAAAQREMRNVNGRLVVNPTGEHFVGERIGFKLEVDFIPPGEQLQLDWRWTYPGLGRELKFFSNGPGFQDRTTAQEIELDTPFWGLSYNEIKKAGGFEARAYLYIGDSKTPVPTSTGFIAMPERPIPELKVSGAPERVVKDSYLDLGIAPWTPDWDHHELDWFVDGDQVATDQLGLRRQFSKLGKHTVRADVYRIERKFGGGDKTFLKNASTTFDVLTDEQYGTKFLDDMESSPFRTKPVGLAGVVSSGDTSLTEIQHRIDQGGSQQPYWKDRLKAQQDRLDKIKELAPDYATMKPLPADPTKLAPGSYNAPVTAALVMSDHGGGAQPLNMQLTIHGSDGAWHARLLDTTSKKVMKYDGDGTTPLAAYTAAFDTWHSNNEYPTGGHVVHRFQPPGWTGGQLFNTTTAWKKAKEWVDGLIQVGALVMGLLLLADPDPTISKLLGGILMAAVVARSSVAIYERIRDGGDVLSTENILDGVAIVTSVMGVSGGVLRGVGLNVIKNPTVYRIGNWMIMTAVAADAGTFIYASASAVASLRAIQGDPTLDDGQKAAEMMRIMASLFISGAMLIVSNKELLRNGLKPNDFIKSEIKPGMNTELDVGARLDAEYELKKGGQWTKDTPKLTNEELLDKVFANRSRQEIEAKLATKVDPKRAKALADALGNDALIELHGKVGEDTLAALAQDVNVAKLKDLHGALGTTEFGNLTQEVGVAGVKRLTDHLSGDQIKQLRENLGKTALTNLAGGAHGIGGDEISALIKTHGDAAVRWAGDTLHGTDAKQLLGAVKPDAIKGLMDVPAADAQKNVAVFGHDVIDKSIPPMTGKQFNTERIQLGEKTAKGVADRKLQKGKVGVLETHADNLAGATTTPHTPLGAGSLVVDSNVLSAIKELMTGTKWIDLQPHKKIGINKLRARAIPPLGDLAGDPTARDVESIIGKGHDLRAANVTLGESAPEAGLNRSGMELSIPRESAQYSAALDELNKPPAVGERKGVADRAIVADTMFAKGRAIPELMTGDYDMIKTLFEKYGPGKTKPITRKPKQSVVGAIAEQFPNGYDAVIPDGAGGTKTIKVTPMAETK